MPIRVLGMIGATPSGPQAAMSVIRGRISTEYLRDFSKVHENAGFDMALIGYTSSSADGFQIALYAAMHTERLGFLLAHRPGFVAPTLAARKLATLDLLTGGRVALHVITGLSDAEQQSEGDFSPKPERYRRAAEYLDILRRTLTSDKPFDFDGEFYRVLGASSDVRPLQMPYPPLFFGGSSEAALEMGAKHCDVFAIYAEPLAATRARIDDFRKRAAVHGRRLRFNMSVRPIIAATENAAWDKARKILAEIKAQPDRRNVPASRSAERLLGFAAQGEVHDERLWMPIATATSAQGNSSCLVGTPEQVSNAILEYYKLGVELVLIRGFDPYNDTIDYGRELIPRLKAGALEIEAAATAAE